MRSRLALRAAAVLALLAAGSTAAAAQTYHAIWGSAPNDIWAVADNGIAVHFDGTSWTSMRTGTEHGLLGVWGSAPNDVWAVGEGGAIMRWNGSAWSVVPAPTRFNLIAVAGCAANDVYAVTEAEDERTPATLLRWNGSVWAKQTVAVGFFVAGLVASCPDMLIAGASYFDPRPDQRRDAGVLMRGRAGAWTVTGWNGRTIVNPDIGSWSWFRMASRGGVSVMLGSNMAGEIRMVSSARNGPWRQMPPAQLNAEETAGEVRYAVAGDGVVLAASRSGFARWRSGTWANVRTDAFGPEVSIWGPTGNDFYVLGRRGTIHHVSGDRAEVAYTPGGAPAAAAPAGAAPAPMTVSPRLLVAPVKRKKP